MNEKFFYIGTRSKLIKFLTDEILKIAKKSILKKNYFSIVFTGGRSAIHICKALSKRKCSLNKWHIYLSDERFLSKNHLDRNDTIIKKFLLSKKKYKKKNIHFYLTELGLREAKSEYLKKINKIKNFDLVLLSVGEDGHVGSLFPGVKFKENQKVIIEKNSPKFPKKRIGISLNMLNKTTHLFKILIGESKKNISRKMIKGENIFANKLKANFEKIFIEKKLVAKVI